MSNQYLSFDVSKSSDKQQLIIGRRGDNSLKFVTITLWNGQDGKPYNLIDKQVIFEGIKPDGTRIIDTSGILLLNPINGLFRYTFNEQSFSSVGNYQQAFFKVTSSDGSLQEATLDLNISVQENMVEFGINSDNYLSEYNQLIADVKNKFTDFAATVSTDIDKVNQLHGDIENLIEKINQNQVITPIDSGENVNALIKLHVNDLGIGTKPIGYQGQTETDDRSDHEYALIQASSSFINITNLGYDPQQNLLVNTFQPNSQHWPSLKGYGAAIDSNSSLVFNNGETLINYNGNGEFYYRFNIPKDNDLGGLIAGGLYTFSLDLKSSTTINFRWQVQTSSNSWENIDNSEIDMKATDIYDRKNTTFRIPQDAKAIYISIQATNPKQGDYFAFRKSKLEIGDIDTGYINGGDQ